MPRPRRAQFNAIVGAPEVRPHLNEGREISSSGIRAGLEDAQLLRCIADQDDMQEARTVDALDARHLDISGGAGA